MCQSCLAVATKHRVTSHQRRIAALARVTLIMLGLLLAAAFARPARAADEEKDKPLPPEDTVLTTSDGVTIATTIYPSKLKKAVPIILLHASKGSRGDFEDLALQLQRAGHAVVVPDMRGHGESARGTDRPGEMRPADYLAIVEPGGDLETIKQFLMTKNNAGEINIEKLCVVGVEMGAVVAINWAARDWSWPALANGKQGEDVKVLVLISPEWSYKGLRINEAVAHPNVRQDLAVLLVVGKRNGKLLKEARRLHSALEKYHAPAAGDAQTLALHTPQTALQATRLLNEKSMHVGDTIVKFINARVAKQPIPWSERKSPLQ
jgi:pimeloyl-ACP methyl ester carboxylesterase